MAFSSIDVWSKEADSMQFWSGVECKGCLHLVPFLCRVERQLPCGSIVLPCGSIILWSGEAVCMWCATNVWREEVVANLLCGSIVVWSGEVVAVWFHCFVDLGGGCRVVSLLCGVERWLVWGWHCRMEWEMPLPCGSIVVWSGEVVAMWFHYVWSGKAAGFIVV